MRKRTPQEKKQLSLSKDRRYSYGESPHSARKSIPLNKRLRNRANRKMQEQVLTVAVSQTDDETLEKIENRLNHKAPKVWEKYPDQPLLKKIISSPRRRKIVEKKSSKLQDNGTV